jgi:hypothetical protein
LIEPQLVEFLGLFSHRWQVISTHVASRL